MARLIDADKRIAEIKKLYCDGCDNYGGAKCRACWVDDAMCLIEDATTVDAVEVVRCKDCTHWGGVPFGNVCRRWSAPIVGMKNCTGPDDFCSYGEEK